MKFKIGDKVLVTAGKDKGKQSKVIAVFPKKNLLTVEGVNMYTKHIKPYAGQSGQKIRKERPMNPAKVAILNDKDKADRIKYEVAKDGKKVRTFRKTGKLIDKK